MARTQQERDIEIANRRFDYDIRNKGVNRAMDEMFGRNAVRRESDRRAAIDKQRSEIDNNIGRNIEEQRRKRTHI